ncbi:hypothetical protein BLOT_015179 [Blomia tropicalis]|nr:hypothetical protein BLOT_015179 [Blomia tropicalis]
MNQDINCDARLCKQWVDTHYIPIFVLFNRTMLDTDLLSSVGLHLITSIYALVLGRGAKVKQQVGCLIDMIAIMPYVGGNHQCKCAPELLPSIRMV